MLLTNNIKNLLISGFITVIFLKILTPFLKKHLIDKPNKRSSHISPKPTSGGISFVIVSTFLMALQGNYNPIISLPLSIVGLFDDIKNVKQRDRYIVQFSTVTVLLSSSLFFQNIIVNYPFYLKILFFIFFIFLFTGLINFINFMDGLDGLVCGSMIIIITSGSILISNSYWPLVGSLLAFLLFNWSPSKIFMGDVGSTYLGGVLTGLILLSNSWIIAFKIFFISAPLIFDALVCIPRRFLNNQSIFEAHKSHLYQRLHQAGWSHASVSTLYIFFTLILSLNIIFLNIKIASVFLIAELIIAIWLDQNKALPFVESIRKNKI